MIFSYFHVTTSTLLQFLCVFWQTADKEAPGLIRMLSLAYLIGFPASLKETEQLRVKLPSVILNKVKQVHRPA